MAKATRTGPRSLHDRPVRPRGTRPASLRLPTAAGRAVRPVRLPGPARSSAPRACPWLVSSWVLRLESTVLSRTAFRGSASPHCRSWSPKSGLRPHPRQGAREGEDGRDPAGNGRGAAILPNSALSGLQAATGGKCARARARRDGGTDGSRRQSRTRAASAETALPNRTAGDPHSRNNHPR